MSTINVEGRDDAAAGPLPAGHILLSPLRLGAVQLANRILMAPMTRTRAAVDGTASELMAEFYAQRASAGLVITEGTFPSAIGRAYLNQPGICTDAHQRGWARVADRVWAAGGRIFVQLMDSGRVSHPDMLGGLSTIVMTRWPPASMVVTASSRS